MRQIAAFAAAAEPRGFIGKRAPGPLVAVMGAIPAHCARNCNYGKANRLVAGALELIRIGRNRL